VDCGLWYLAEYEDGEFKLNRDPKEFTSVEEYLKKQGRFSAMDDADIAQVVEERNSAWARMRRDWKK